jgi:hypothetical protein
VGKVDVKIGLLFPRKLKLIKDDSVDDDSSEFKDCVELFPPKPRKN